MGVLYLPAELEDSYHKRLAAGYYTLRYARMDPSKMSREKRDKEDEEKSAAATNPDVVLLSRIESDNTAAPIPLEKLVTQAKSSADGKQPAAMRLLPVNAAYKTFPAVVSDDLGNCAVQFRLQTRSSTEKKPLAISILLFILPDFGAED